MNSLGHNFQLIKGQKYTKTYICDRCNCEVDKYYSGQIVIWTDGLPEKLISCEQYIIKSIIE